MKSIRFVCALLSLFMLWACSSAESERRSAVHKSSDAVYARVENAKTTVAWHGWYQGIFPCSGCEGIATALKLNPDSTYTLRTRELGKEEKDKKSEGKFIWLDNSSIQLTGGGQKRNFRVGKDFLQLITPDGKPVPSSDPKKYILEKTD